MCAGILAEQLNQLDTKQNEQDLKLTGLDAKLTALIDLTQTLVDQSDQSAAGQGHNFRMSGTRTL